MITSPFIRTLQTAAYFKNGLIGADYKKDLILNNNIVVKLGTNSGKIFSEGVLKKDGVDKTLANWMDCKPSTMQFVKDEGAVELYKADGSYTDSSASKRYTTGFKDIV